jgi:hypothetical protein
MERVKGKVGEGQKEGWKGFLVLSGGMGKGVEELAGAVLGIEG